MEDTAAARQYRTRLEILRDVLSVGSAEANKTRLIRIANLNPACFDRYVGFCVQSGFLELKGDRYRTTSSGENAIGAIGRILAKAEELDSAVRELGSVARRGSANPEPVGQSLRFASAAAWSELMFEEARDEVRESRPLAGVLGRQVPGVRPSGVSDPISRRSTPSSL